MATIAGEAVRSFLVRGLAVITIVLILTYAWEPWELRS
jgi:hypothetical protein